MCVIVPDERERCAELGRTTACGDFATPVQKPYWRYDPDARENIFRSDERPSPSIFSTFGRLSEPASQAGLKAHATAKLGKFYSDHDCDCRQMAPGTSQI